MPTQVCLLVTISFWDNDFQQILFTADGATFERRSRQFHGVNTIVPDAPNLIVSISIGQDLLPSGKTGALLTESINNTLLENKIESNQLSSLVFDGAVLLSHVDDLLRDYHNRSSASLPACGTDRGQGAPTAY